MRECVTKRGCVRDRERESARARASEREREQRWDASPPAYTGARQHGFYSKQPSVSRSASIHVIRSNDLDGLNGTTSLRDARTVSMNSTKYLQIQRFGWSKRHIKQKSNAVARLHCPRSRRCRKCAIDNGCARGSLSCVRSADTAPARWDER